jgi:glutathione synthase/RimK-type ligase-like ATP-grasp enzyme
MRRTNRKPMIIKPVDGKRSQGRFVCNTAKRARKIMVQWFEKRTNPDTPFYIQPFDPIAREFRVMLVNGAIIATIEKVKRNRQARGSAFVVPERDDDIVELELFCLSNCSHSGVVGADVAILENGRTIMIEENRAPGWKRFQQALGFNVAEKIYEILLDDNS